MSTTAPAKPIQQGERVWTGNFTEDRRNWPKLTFDEIYAGIAEIEAESPELYANTQETDVNAT